MKVLFHLFHITRSQPITPFCNQFSTVGGATQRGCTVDRDFGAICTLDTYQSNVPDEYMVGNIWVYSSLSILVVY